MRYGNYFHEHLRCCCCPNEKSTLVQVMDGYRQATSHYQCGSRFISHTASLTLGHNAFNWGPTSRSHTKLISYQVYAFRYVRPCRRIGQTNTTCIKIKIFRRFKTTRLACEKYITHGERQTVSSYKTTSTQLTWSMSCAFRKCQRACHGHVGAIGANLGPTMRKEFNYLRLLNIEK